MYLTKYTLQRGHQTIVLQGMVHVSSDARLYKRIQKDINHYYHLGHTFMSEGYPEDDQASPYWTAEERSISLFLKALEGTYSTAAEAEAFKEQSAAISLPYDCRSCDMSLRQTVNALCANGFRPNVRYLEILGSSEFQNLLTTADVGAHQLLVQELFDLEQQRKIGMDPVLIHERNRYVVRKMERFLHRKPDGKIYLPYGENHVQGITKRLLLGRWNISERRKLWYTDSP